MLKTKTRKSEEKRSWSAGYEAYQYDQIIRPDDIVNIKFRKSFCLIQFLFLRLPEQYFT
jgi:hypothetical protein